MTNIQIKYFLEVARNESFSKAAETLFVSHQVLSSQIKALEKELDVELINRSNKRKIRLTDAGQVLFDAWSEMAQIQDKAMMQARKLQEEQRNTLVIGIQDMRFVRSYVVPMIRKLQESSLKINLEYRLGSPIEMKQMLEDGQVDMLILVSSDYEPDRRLHTEVLRKDALHIVAAMAKDHPLSKKKKLKLQDLKNETILMISSHYSEAAPKRFQNDLKQMGMDHAKIKYIQSPRAINIAVTTGVGVALIFDELLEEDRDEMKIFPIFLPNAKGTDMILVWKDEKLNPMAEHMLKIF